MASLVRRLERRRGFGGRLADMRGDIAGTRPVVNAASAYSVWPNLRRLVNDTSVLKLFHFGRFDIAALNHYIGTDCRPVYCTKIASRLTRTYTDRHGLRELCREFLGIDLSKEQQSSDWAAPELSKAQQEYAASDVLYLHRLKEALDGRLKRERRMEMAQAAFNFLPTRAAMDIAGFEAEDIFAHS